MSTRNIAIEVIDPDLPYIRLKKYYGFRYIYDQISHANEFPQVEIRTAMAVGIARQCESYGYSLEDLIVDLVERATNLRNPDQRKHDLELLLSGQVNP